MPGANRFLDKLFTNHSRVDAGSHSPGSGKLSIGALLRQFSFYLTQEYITSSSQAFACAHANNFADTQDFAAAMRDGQNLSTSMAA